jgi:hypothetical protein
VFFEASRWGNFSQSRASIERQREMSFDPNAVNRSIEGGLGEGGWGPFPQFLLDNAFRDDLPVRTPKSELPWDWTVVQSFDHALRNDDNVLTTFGMPWPMTIERLQQEPIHGLAIDIKKSSRSLTPTEQFSVIRNNALLYDPRAIVIDATAEGGLLVYREAQDQGFPAEKCSFTGRTPGSIRISNKEYGIQWLQRLLSHGLHVSPGPSGWIEDWNGVDTDKPFGLIRLPAQKGEWARLKRQLAVFRRDDTDLTQDAAITLIMFAWWAGRFLDAGGASQVQKFSMLGRRVPRVPRDRRNAYAGVARMRR